MFGRGLMWQSGKVALGQTEKMADFNRFLQVTLCRNLETHEKCCTFALSKIKRCSCYN